jgi:thermitase
MAMLGRRFMIGLIMLCTLTITSLSSTAAQGPPEFAAGEILVKFKPGTPAEVRADVHRQHGGQVKRVIPRIDVQVVGIPAGQEKAKAEAYSRNPNVLFAEPNGIVRAIGVPNDPRGGEQWQYNNTSQTGGTADADIDAFEAWDVTPGSASVAIAVLDTGIDQDHEDLGTKVTKNANFTDSATVDDIQGHGTHVAGSVAAITNNGKGVAGTCPNCSLHNGKVLGDSGWGYLEWIANGIIWAADNGAKVINMSLGGTGGSSTLESAVNYAWDKKLVVVAGAGNNGVSDPFYPAYYTNAIAVAATDHNDAKASFSNYGSWVDVAAPGVSILSTTNDGAYGLMQGTSMASPHVAGLAGLIWSANLCGSDNTCVRNQIESKADRISGTGTNWAHGRVNAYNSVTPSATCKTSSTSWQNNALTAQSGTFTASFDATPNNARMDGVTGLAGKSAAGYADLAAIVRFNTSGMIDARNGGAYQAASQIPYTAGTSYRFRLVIRVPSHTYDIFVTPAGGTEQTVGTNFAFRTEQRSVTSINNWALYAASGTHRVCNVAVANTNANLLKNASFELDANADTRPDDWTSNSKFTRNNTVTYSGSYVGRHRATDNGNYIIGQSVTVAAGSAYQFAGWVNIPSTSDAFKFKLEVRWKNSSGSTISTTTIKSYTAATSGWNLATGSLTAPTGATSATIRMNVSSLNATIYVDDFLFGRR